MKISFPRTVCKYCGCNEQYVVLKKYRYGIYCEDCGKLVKWAGSSEVTIIKAREAWLKEHDRSKETTP